MKLITASLLSFSMLIGSAQAVAPRYDSTAPIAFMKDTSSGAVLYSKDADRRIPPASMAKMMTAYVIFDRVSRGQLKLTDTFPVREATWKKWNNQGSSMFLAVGQEVSVANLLHGVITLSGNDACVVLAEGIAGSEDAFADMMNATARRLGLNDSHFANSNGWPDEGRTYVSARDLAELAYRTVTDYPELYRQYYSRTSFKWNGIEQENRDPLLGRVKGADGLKTGHTDEAGYGFTGSAEQNGRRIVMVVAGLDSFKGRIDESVRFMDWGFNAWKAVPLFRKGAVAGTADVQLGSDRSIGLVAPRDLAVTLPKSEDSGYRVFIRYDSPIKAPFAKGQKIAELVVRTRSGGEQVMPLVAAETIEKAGFFGRIWNGLMSLLGL